MPERTAADQAILDNENESVIEQEGGAVPRQPDPPPRFRQDTQPVEGEDVVNPRPDTAPVHRRDLQG